MHRKRVLFVHDGLAVAQTFASAVASIDADYTSCGYSDIASRLREADLAVCMADARTAANMADYERALISADNTPTLIIVDPSSLKTLRLPTHVPCDFAVEQASADELAVRMRHLLWPGEEVASSDFISVDSMTINLATYQVQVNGEPVDFTYLEYALLAFLASHPGHAYSRDALLRRVWGFDYYGGSRTVDVHVRRVRAKLGTELAERLVTVRGVGYMFEL